MRAILPLLLLCLALRSVIPAGWMPVFDANGAALVPCSGFGPIDVKQSSAHFSHGENHSGAAGHDGSNSKHDMAGQPCSFASATASFPPPAPTAALAISVPFAPILGIVFVVAIGRGLAAPPPPAIGPPLLT